MDPRDLTSDEFMLRIQVLSDALMRTRRELDAVTVERDELFTKYDDLTLTLCEREKQLAYCEDLVVLSQQSQSQSQSEQNEPQWMEPRNQDPLSPTEQDRLQDATSAALSGMRSILEEKNRVIERYREKVDQLQNSVPVKSTADRRADALLQSLDAADSEAVLVSQSIEFNDETKNDDGIDRLRDKVQNVMLSDKNRQINTLETTLEMELLRRERAELRCADSVHEMDAMKADMLMLVQRLRESEQRYLQLLGTGYPSTDDKRVEVRTDETRARKQETKDDDIEETAVEDTSTADLSLVASPLRTDSTDHLKLNRLVKAREEQLRKQRDIIAKLKGEIVRMEQQHAAALLKASSSPSSSSAQRKPEHTSAGDDVNDLKRQVISLRDSLRETKDDLERSRKAREKLIQLKHSAVEEARGVTSQLTRAEAQAQAYQDTLQRTRGELEEVKKKEKKLREKVKEFGADPDIVLLAQSSSSPRAASIALHKECAMLRTQNSQLRQLIAQAALATDDGDVYMDSPGKKRKSTLVRLDTEESKNDSFSSERDGDDRVNDGETALLRRFVVYFDLLFFCYYNNSFVLYECRLNILENRLREKVSENLDLMAQLAQTVQNQARDASVEAVVEFSSSKGEGTNTRRSKTPSQPTSTRTHKPGPQEWVELEHVRSELFALEIDNRRLRRRAEVELANEVGGLFLFL